MSSSFTPAPSPSTSNKPLWAAVGVLGIAVLAMGATLIRIQTRPEEPRLAVLSTAAPAPMAAASVTPAAVPTAPLDSDKVAAEKKALAPVNHAKVATQTVATKVHAPMQTETSMAVDQPVVHRTKPICATCGTVESVTPIQRDGTGSGGGAIAGGVLGAVVGNQMGGGDGKTLATILGAVGGGFAGNAVEKKMKKETYYQVVVRMEDGSTRTLEQTAAASVGAKVMVEGQTLQPASR